jgi:hypothetical protein
MNNLKTYIYALILAVFVVQIGLTSNVQAAQLGILSKNSQKELTLTESPEGKLLVSAKNVKKPNKVVKTVLTAYSSTPDQTDDDPFIAASGKRVYDGMVAANWLPFGTKIKIPSLYGEKIFTVDDRMNARYGYGRMDIWMDAPRAQVNKFGVQRVEIEIYYAEKPTKVKVAKVENI